MVAGRGPHGPCPHSTDGAPPNSFKILTPKLALENTVWHTALWAQTSLLRQCWEFSLWLVAKAGQMAVTVTMLSLGCGPTRSMISWESTGDGPQPEQKAGAPQPQVFEVLLLPVNQGPSMAVLWEDWSGVACSPRQLALLGRLPYTAALSYSGNQPVTVVSFPASTVAQAATSGLAPPPVSAARASQNPLWVCGHSYRLL